MESANHPNYLEKPPGLSWLGSWIFSTDHKRIGLLYMFCVIAFFLVGGTLGLLMRLEMLTPGKTIIGPQGYNALFTVHGVIMIFLVVIPSIPAAFGNMLLPIQIGAKDVFFPRLNLLSWWVYFIGAGLAVTSLFTGGGPPDTGWTFYVPFSTMTKTNVTLSVFAAFVLGFSSILTGVNFITTIHRMKPKGMPWMQMPLFAWSLYFTAWIQILATPILATTLLLILVERIIGFGLFDPAKGGDPVLYQHLFWIYSHPAVYIMILPAMGVISEIVPVFARKPAFGYGAIVASGAVIAFAGSLVWGHHMFTSGMSDTAVMVFSFLTFIVAIPSAIKVFNWVATLYKGSIHLDPPLLYALAFIFLFMLGGVQGLILGAAGTDLHVHDTYFVVGHFHYMVFGGTMFGFFAALHYWLPKMFGRLYNFRWSAVAWVLSFVGFNLLYGTMMIMGLQGMPRRYFDFPPEFQTGHTVATIGSWILAAGIVIMLVNLWAGIRNGRRAGPNPWGGATLEWTIPSPPTVENFEGDPDLSRGPYDFKNLPVPHA